ncbi:MAG: FixH family protein [Anaerolineae bacterium]|nr:FixH family protein [Anaerolineae bacterium]
MKSIILILTLALVLTACGAQNTVSIVEDITIELTVEPNPPAVGEATLVITVLDADNSPIDGASITVHGNMDHEGMTPIDSETSDSSDGVYQVPFQWSMGGGWVLDVTVTLPDNRGIATAQFDQFVEAISQDSIINRHETGNDLDINIHYMPDNDPAIVGNANVTVIVTNADGHPVNDATISLIGDMPEHDMLPVTGEASTGEEGRYLIPLNWTMAGEWDVEITVTLIEGQSVTETYKQMIVMDEQ